MKRLIVVLFLSLTSVSALSSPASDLSRVRFAEALLAVEVKEVACEDQRITLPSDALDGVEMTHDQLVIALSYYYFKTGFECAKDAIGHFLIEASTLASFSPDEAEDILEGSQLIPFAHRKMIETELEYKQLVPTEIREHLEGLQVLQQPFRLRESSEALRK